MKVDILQCNEFLKHQFTAEQSHYIFFYIVNFHVRLIEADGHIVYVYDIIFQTDTSVRYTE